MKKLLKILFYILLTLIIIALIGGFLAARFINPNNYKDKIAAVVLEKTGRNLTINGEIELSFFPWIGVRVHDMKLSNAAGFQPATFASVGEADVRVKLLPLISKQVEIGRIALRDLNLNLAKNAAGVTNWQDFTAKTAAQGTTPTVAPQKQAIGKMGLLSIAGVDMENATITWVDASKGQTVILKNLQLKSDAPTLGRSFPLRLTFDINSKKPDIAGHFTLKSDVIADQEKANYQLNGLRISFQPPQQDVDSLSLEAKQVAANLHSQTLTISKGVLSNGNLNATFNVEAQQILNKPTFKGEINAAPFNLKGVLKTLGKTIDTTNPNALQNVSLRTRFTGDAQSIQLNPLNLQLDRSNIEGMLAVTDFATQALRFNIHVDQIDLDSYLPPASQGATSAATPSAGVVAGSSSAPPSAMREVNINGELQVGKLVVKQIELNQLTAKMTSQNGVLNVNPLNANVYKGTMRGKVAIDYRGALPKYTINEALSDIDMTQLVKSGRVIGKANVVTNLTLQGQSKEQMLRSLSGTVQFNVKNGALMGTNVPYQVDRAVALLKKQPSPPAPAAEDRTSFDILQGTGTFSGGIFTNKDLLLQSAEFKGTGEGSANLVTEALDYRLRLVGLQTVTNAQGQTSQAERRTPIPVRITGTFDKPIVTPDLQALIQSELGQKAVETIQEKIGGDTGKAVGGILQQILK